MLPIFAQVEPEGFNLNNTIDSLARTPLSVVLLFTLAFTIVRVLLFKPLFSAPMHRRHHDLKFLKFIDETMDALIYTGIFVFMVLRPFIFQTFMVPSGSMVSTLLVGDYLVANKAIYRYTNPHAGDIVVFRPPKEACYENQIDKDSGEVKVDFVKRCIGTPGDLIEVHDNILYRNGVKWDEPYKHYTAPDPPGQFNLFREMTKQESDSLDKEDFKLVKYKGEYWPVRIKGDLVNDPSLSTVEKYALHDPEEMRKVKSLPAEKVPPGHYLMWGDNRLWSLDGRAWGLVTEENIVGRAEFVWLPLPHWGRTRTDSGSPEK